MPLGAQTIYVPSASGNLQVVARGWTQKHPALISEIKDGHVIPRSGWNIKLIMEVLEYIPAIELMELVFQLNTKLNGTITVLIHSNLMELVFGRCWSSRKLFKLFEFEDHLNKGHWWQTIVDLAGPIEVI